MDKSKKYFVEGQSRIWYTNYYIRAVNLAKTLSKEGETVYVWGTKKKKVLRIYRSGVRAL